MRSPVNPIRNILLFLFAVGLGCSVIAALLWMGSHGFVDNAVHAQGMVIALSERIGRKTTTWPIVAFRTAEGRRVEFESQVPNRSLLPVGTPVDVLYIERDPSKARIDSWLDLWGPAFFFGLLGLFFVGLSLTILLFVVRTSSREVSAG